MAALHEKFQLRSGPLASERPLATDFRVNSACNLCLEFSRHAPPLHCEMIDGVSARRVLLETTNFVVVPSIGALRAGHLLVLPKLHALGVLKLPPPMIQECEALVQSCARRLQKLYGEPAVIFEHGTADESAAAQSSCISHAHIHVLPGSREFVSFITGENKTSLKEWQAHQSLTHMPPPSGEYLIVGSTHDAPRLHLRLCRPLAPTPSQFFRRAFAEYIGSKLHWDWRLEPAGELFSQTLSDWQACYGEAKGA